MLCASLRLETLRVFAAGANVVLAQHGVWLSVETGDVMGEGAIASRFRVDGERITQYGRYDYLDNAFAEAGLTAADEEG